MYRLEDLRLRRTVPGRRVDGQQAQFAADSHTRFFEIHTRFRSGAESEGIDVIHRRDLGRVLLQCGIEDALVNQKKQQALVVRWHSQVGEC